MKKHHVVTGLVALWGVQVGFNSSSAFADLEVSTYKLADVATVKPNATVQVWGIGNEKTSSKNQNIRLRRVEFKVSGSVADAGKYFLMVDPARLIPPPGGKNISADNMLQDFGVSSEVMPGFELTVGQFKAPQTAEGLDSSSSLILPERSLVGRALGDRREMGLKAAYKTPLWNVASMISTGRAIYGTGTGTFNDLHARVELTPVKDLSYGAFATLGNGLDYSKKGRWGVNARYSISGAVLRAEYAQAKDAAVQSRGLTTEVGYFVTPRFQPVIRYEMFSPNQAATTATTLAQAETIGVNYLLPEYNMKLQLSGSALQNLADPNGTPALSKGVHNAEVTMAVQGTL